MKKKDDIRIFPVKSALTKIKRKMFTIFAVNPILVKGIAIGLAAIVLVYCVLSAFGARRAMEIPRLPLNFWPSSYGLKYKDVFFPSRDDNVKLKGWFLPGGNTTAVLIVNGGFENRVDENSDTLGITGDLVAKGYDVLLFDLRGRGESEGKGRSLLNIEKDIGGAVDYLLQQGYDAANICILGFCSGAASACIFAGQNKVGAVILDGCFVDVPMIVVREAGTERIPSWLTRIFIPGLTAASRLFYGYRIINPIDVVGEIKCPVFFIHEQYDNVITREETRRLFLASRNPANQIWEVGNAQHSQSFRTDGKEYIQKVDDFLKTRQTKTTG
jgi:dienelactone hydrolase